MLVMDLIDSHFYLLNCSSIEARSLPLQASLLKETKMDLKFEKQMKYKRATTAADVHHVLALLGGLGGRCNRINHYQASD